MAFLELQCCMPDGKMDDCDAEAKQLSQLCGTQAFTRLWRECPALIHLSFPSSKLGDSPEGGVAIGHPCCSTSLSQGH